MSNLKKIEGGVTTPQGFTAGAVYTAIKKRENKKPCGVVTPPSIFFRVDMWGDLLS